MVIEESVLSLFQVALWVEKYMPSLDPPILSEGLDVSAVSSSSSASNSFGILPSKTSYVFDSSFNKPVVLCSHEATNEAGAMPGFSFSFSAVVDDDEDEEEADACVRVTNKVKSAMTPGKSVPNGELFHKWAIVNNNPPSVLLAANDCCENRSIQGSAETENAQSENTQHHAQHWGC